MAKLNEDMVTAAKAKDKIRLSALRLLKTALHNKEIDLMRPLNETETMQILSGLVKQRKDSIEQFAKGGRQDLVEKEEAELKILQDFMPAQMSDEEVEALIKKAIADVGALSVKDMGKVMKALMPQITGKADGKAAGEKVKALLSQ
ncbi:MAG TPA: GatB/YqeY domain-containing protein [Smithellaceae bacterium]|nr:GatB/YqeY domain-containing protein [Smithellaceae bacterium]HNY96745.1 GatB/YqeY domain-containing protein [Smithellaceae bacterium]HOD63728.1 GatB/YqeY domain-containing protein [Smithellaceae bacterium]HOE22700.1 GatB/YqeY domain-containing protein [Smithellaceae bacterium]HOH57553.1 GatB/YqeY domain-containing protein [Smithellaceae bacterium]